MDTLSFPPEGNIQNSLDGICVCASLFNHSEDSVGSLNEIRSMHWYEGDLLSIKYPYEVAGGVFSGNTINDEMFYRCWAHICTYFLHTSSPLNTPPEIGSNEWGYKGKNKWVKDSIGNMLTVDDLPYPEIIKPHDAPYGYDNLHLDYAPRTASDREPWQKLYENLLHRNKMKNPNAGYYVENSIDKFKSLFDYSGDTEENLKQGLWDDLISPPFSESSGSRINIYTYPKFISPPFMLTGYYMDDFETQFSCDPGGQILKISGIISGAQTAEEATVTNPTVLISGCNVGSVSFSPSETAFYFPFRLGSRISDNRITQPVTAISPWKIGLKFSNLPEDHPRTGDHFSFYIATVSFLMEEIIIQIPEYTY